MAEPVITILKTPNLKKACLLMCMLIWIQAGCADQKSEPIESTTPAPSPEDVVMEQIKAYNEGDIEGFLDTYADDIRYFNQPDTLMYSGIAQLKESFTAFFSANPDVHVEVKNRLIQGNFVILHELVSGISGVNDMSVAAIYEVKDGKIVNLWFIY
jgi:hypothetical protein